MCPTKFAGHLHSEMSCATLTTCMMAKAPGLEGSSRRQVEAVRGESKALMADAMSGRISERQFKAGLKAISERNLASPHTKAYIKAAVKGCQDEVSGMFKSVLARLDADCKKSKSKAACQGAKASGAVLATTKKAGKIAAKDYFDFSRAVTAGVF